MDMVEDLRKAPAFAALCSFFNKFGSILGLKPLSFNKLESIFDFNESGKVDKELIDLHVRLLRKAGMRSAGHAKWEFYILKFCKLHRTLIEEYFTVERFGYAHSSLATKLNILKTLCEIQFDYNHKFKEQLSSCTASELRLLPVGIDCAGQAYWYQLDADLNLRIYSEEADDSAGSTWRLRAKDRDDLAKLVQKLESGESPNGDLEGEESRYVSEESDNEDSNHPSTSKDNQNGTGDSPSKEPEISKPSAAKTSAKSTVVENSAVGSESNQEELKTANVKKETPEKELDEKPVAELEKKPVEELSDKKPVIEPDDKPVAEPDEKPVYEPDEKPVIKPDKKPLAEPDEKPVIEPDEKPVCEPDKKPVTEPVQEQIVENGVASTSSGEEPLEENETKKKTDQEKSSNGDDNVKKEEISSDEDSEKEEEEENSSKLSAGKPPLKSKNKKGIIFEKMKLFSIFD